MAGFFVVQPLQKTQQFKRHAEPKHTEARTAQEAHALKSTNSFQNGNSSKASTRLRIFLPKHERVYGFFAPKAQARLRQSKRAFTAKQEAVYGNFPRQEAVYGIFRDFYGNIQKNKYEKI